MSAPKTYHFPPQLTQAVVSYLATKPWAEVNGMLVALQQEINQQEEAAKQQEQPPLSAIGDQPASPTVQ